MKHSLIAALLLALVGFAPAARAADETKIEKMDLADGKISLAVPKDWKKVAPSSKIIEFEFSAPKVDGDANDARITVMGAGGSVEANIERWFGQFTQPDGKATAEVAKNTKSKIAGCDVHVADITGTFKDQRGPFAPAKTYENYRMLGAIIVTEKHGQHFVKMYGPKATMAAQEKAFNDMLQTLKVAE